MKTLGKAKAVLTLNKSDKTASRKERIGLVFITLMF